MAGSRTASDDRLFMVGVVVAVWLASLAAVSLLLSIGQRAATTPPVAAPATPPLTPAETLPPTVVTAERADAYDCGPSSERRPADRHCAPVGARREPAADHARSDAGRAPTP